jgi:hypothetical protein
MLHIVGSPKVRQKYTRLPMHDGIGKVTAYLHWNRVTYRPIGGSEEARLIRATLIAAQTGGVLGTRVKRTTTSYTVTVHF